MTAVTSIAQFIPVLQTAIGPMILISGIGLLLLTMTNRLGRTIDLSRGLLGKYVACNSERRSVYDREINVLWKRARYVRAAILFASSTCLGAATLIILLFLSTLLEIEMSFVLIALFIMSMLCLIVSLIFFLLDVNLTLSALRIALEERDRD